MRYSRLESRMKAGGLIESRTTTSAARPTKTATPKPAKLATKKRKKHDAYESDSAEFSHSGDEQPDEDMEVESEEPPTKRQTRGVQLNLKGTLDDSSDLSAEDSGSNTDEYKEPIKKEGDIEEDASHTNHAPKYRKQSKLNEKLNSARDRRSGTPLITPRRLVSSAGLTSPLKSPSTSSKSAKLAPSMGGLDYDDQIKQEFSGLEAGMMLPHGRPSEEAITTQTQPIKSTTAHVTMSDIIESIEHDEEDDEELEAGDGEESDEDDADDADDEDGDMDEEVAEKAVMGPPPPKKSKFFGWWL
jgi:hypothetical protein